MSVSIFVLSGNIFFTQNWKFRQYKKQNSKLTQNVVEKITVVEIRFKVMFQCWLNTYKD